MIDWSRKTTAAERDAERQEAEARRAERQALKEWQPTNGQLQARVEELEATVRKLIGQTL